MKLTKTKLEGVVILEPDVFGDNRGFFMESWSQKKMEALGIRNESAYMRALALNGYILKLDLPQIREMLRLLGNMTNNLNQIAKRLNAHGNLYETEIEEIQQKQDELAEEYNFLSRRGIFDSFAREKAINYLSDEEKQKFLDNALAKYAGPFIPQENYPLLTHLLATYYLSGPSKTSLKIWDYAISYPLENFNRNAQTNHAYSFLMLLLFVMAGLHCISGILFREDL